MADSIRFYFDQHLWASVARGLRRAGADVLTAQEAGRCGLPDPEQLSFANADERVLVTFDVDYLALHQSGVAHAGIAWCEERKFKVGDLVGALMLLHGVFDRDEMRNHVEYL